MKTLIIDNYDSFTFNLYQLIAAVNNENPIVIRNNQCSWRQISKMEYDNIVISPGPGDPANVEDFGVCDEVIEKTERPVLGVCLGHQGFAKAFGAEIVHAPQPVHGRISKITHGGGLLYRGIPTEFKVVRYHSLVVKDHLPDCLVKDAWTEDGLIMGLHHKNRPIWGVQFHPESIATEYGQRLIENFTHITQNN